jgi:hypothetical protein
VTPGPGIEGLLHELAPQVLGAVMRRFGDFEAADDAAQESILLTIWLGTPRGQRITHVQACTAREPGSAYAALAYSLKSPLRIVRRRTRAAPRSVIGGGGMGAVGGSCLSGLVGRCSLS